METLIGLGGNLGDVPRAFSRAREGLARRCRVEACSGVWRSAPLGPPQPDFCNAALLVSFECHPLELLALCLGLEIEAGRDRSGEQHWGPRALDLDLLLSPGLVVAAPRLELPHPRLHLRRFALLPACELVPGWVHPRQHRTLAELAAALDPEGQPCVRTGPFPP